ncbi:MAG: hypothetical protein JWM95_1087 [Gemmatimonadetes bacterium]|nr:hypothetical protein [Gemmatimonadota bacterium]
MPEHTLTPEIASTFARLALSHVEREFPNKLDHVLGSDDDVRGPRALHPVFYGSFDWHSCVHGYWLLATLLRQFPRLPERSKIHALFDRQLTAEKVAGEIVYLVRPLTAGFERPYGWTWLLMLSAELARHSTVEAKAWRGALKPLASTFVSRFTAFLPNATYPIRVGTHFNSAFAIALALEYADTVHDKRFGRLLRGRAVSWFAADVDCQAWEPGGDDFLSSALIEAECMRRCLEPALFSQWMEKFLPRIAGRDPGTLFTPATVSDRRDGKIAHLDGLNLSRAWCWSSLARAWPDDDSRTEIARHAASVHLNASLSHVAGDYAGEHWLATFALLALSV